MNRMFEILSLEDNQIDYYLNTRLAEEDTSGFYEDVSLSNEGNIYKGWVNTNVIYLPSGNRSKGFKIDVQFIKDFIVDTREKFGPIPLERLKERLTEDTIIRWFNMFVINYFGAECDDVKRKEIYGYGLLNSIGKTLDVSTLKGLNVGRCIEKSACLNQILNFLGIDSSLVLSEANGIGHAYCLVNDNEKHIIVDPNFYGTDTNGKGIPYIFEINPQSDSFSFDPSIYGDYKSLKVNYKFPNQTIPRI